MSSVFTTFVLVSFLMAKYNLSNIQVEVSASKICLAGEELLIVCNIKDLGNRCHHTISFENCYINFLPANGEVSLTTRFKTTDRGKYFLRDLSIYSFYPFGLFSANIKCLDTICWVGPETVSTNPVLLSSGQREVFQHLSAGNEGDFWMFRQYATGEDASNINWKLSAGSTKEWVVINSIPKSTAEKVRFDFFGVEVSLFEDALINISTWLLKESNITSKTLIWSSNKDGNYYWHSVSKDYSSIIIWLAELSPSTFIPKADCDCTELDIHTVLGILE